MLALISLLIRLYSNFVNKCIELWALYKTKDLNENLRFLCLIRFQWNF